MTEPERDGVKFPRCPRCGIIWRQSGNRTGHASCRHRTFENERAFERHQRSADNRKGFVCVDPETEVFAEGTVRSGQLVFDSIIAPPSSCENNILLASGT